MKKMKKLLKNQKGLTLIELLAVIVILAIVAAIAVPSIGNIIDNSRVGAIKGDAQNALAAASLYFTEQNSANNAEVSVKTLKDSKYLDETGSLSVEGTKIKKTTTGNVINGSGTGSGITVTFTNATNAAISAHKNNDNGNDTIGIKVTGR
ncbi:prepilin-type N-terminal cleavage/methylation domain-containing protein [uncultured Psychrobacillus sp.]|uniref:competence type IV pilus major pilin ComGC n=1 Tax=uncultured Psychrobacillus sp. TaxID=1551585 RepID=UPI002626C7A6|nr:prepilin-type N-terminal cleavage/methylation domain-containing protein [uncultured Psychrobacillus sp.]